MQYRKLGRTGLHVSATCLGTMIYGKQVDEKESISIIEKALDSGINFIDSADFIYADGRAEEIVGKVLKGKRQSVILTTKVAYRSGPGVNDLGLSRKHIMDGIESSLRQLQTDYIDIYYAHLWDNDTPLEVTLRAFDDLVSQGKVRYIACTNFRVWQLSKALWTSDKHNLVRFDCYQPPYNLLTRDIDDELLPLCASEELGVCTYNPLAGGMLTGKYDINKTPTEGRFTLDYLGPVYHDRYWSTGNFEAIARFKELAQTLGCTLPQFAIAWILSNKIVTSVILGVSSIKQLEENIKATEIKLSEAELKICDEMWYNLRPPRFSYASQQLKR
ncbi:aldo/keto reductase [Chloroflexota bacterium]